MTIRESEIFPAWEEGGAWHLRTPGWIGIRGTAAAAREGDPKESERVAEFGEKSC